MQTKTIDIIVREYLLDKGLSMHYYVECLHHALRCLDRLSQDYDIITNVRDTTLTIGSNDRVDIPASAIDVIDVYGVISGRRLSWHRDDTLTTEYNLDSLDNQIPWPSEITDYDNQMYEYNMSSSTIDRSSGVFFGKVRNPKYRWSIDRVNNEIILAPNHEKTEVGVLYVTKGVSTSTANVVPYYASDVIIAYIDWKMNDTGKSSNSRSEIKKYEYYNEMRRFKASHFSIGVEDVYNSAFYKRVANRI